jgi:NADH-quinone oxidoreductase subunit M
MLNGFVGEFLILLGTFARSHLWAAFAASGVILSAVYLLWAYQRVIFGDVHLEKNRALPDASRRERIILAVMAVVILWMGIGSPLFTRRMEASTTGLLNQMRRPASYVAADTHPEKSKGVEQYAQKSVTAAETHPMETK